MGTKMKNWMRGISGAVCLGLISATAFAQGAPAGGEQKTDSTGFTILFHVMDWIVIVTLVLCSIAVVALVIDAMIHIREQKIIPPETTEHLRSLIAGRQFKELMDFTATDQSFVSQALYSGIRRAHLKYPAMREALESSVGDQTANLFRRIEFLNVIGNIGPLIGLLGTVLGMIISFYELRASEGAAKPGALAGGIATALWHTFGGLFVAIPALLVYGYYRTRVDKITARAALLSEELLEGLRPEASSSEEKKKLKTMAVPQPMAADRG